MLKNSLLFLLLWNSCSFFAQDTDSLKIINELESYEFSDGASTEIFWDMLLEYDAKLSSEQKVNYRLECAEYAKEFNNDTLYVEFNLKLVKLLLNQLYQTYDIQKSKDILKGIEETVASLNSDYYYGNYYLTYGNPYQREGDYIQAIKYYTKSIDYYKKSKTPGKAISPIYNIANIYTILNNYESSIKYSKELLAFSKYLTPEEALVNDGNAYLSISGAYHYSDEEMQDSVFYYLNKAIKTTEKLDPNENEDFFYTHCYTCLFAIDLYLEEDDLALADFYLANSSICEGKVEPGYSMTLAKYYIKTGAYKQADELLKDTFRLNRHITGEYYHFYLKALYYEGIGNYKKAFIANNKVAEIQKVLSKKEKVQYAAFADSRFDAAKREKEIKALQLKGETNTLKLQLLLLGLSLSITLIVLGVLSYRKLKHNKETIERQSNELKKTEALKSKLFANISHELRTPLTLISTPINNILKQVELKDNDKIQFLLAQKSSQRLLEISNQIMDLLKSESKEIKLNLARFSWGEFLEQIVPTYSLAAKNNGIDIVAGEHYADNILMQSDPSKLKTILGNLFQNAIKFSRIGGIIYLEFQEKGDHLEFSIRDTGIGIEKTELPKVFNRYYQSNNNIEAVGGFGIGLSVCQEYTKLLGGTITVESKIGQGTVIRVNIPKTIATTDTVRDYVFDPVSSPSISTFAANVPKTKRTDAALLLIVEDNEDFRLFLRTILEEEYALSFAMNGMEALKKLETIEPSLIITDWMMPLMNGLEFVKKVKADSKSYKIPVLMLTARSLPIDQLKAFQKGVNDYLLKPFETANLKLRIRHLLDHAAGRKKMEISNDIKYTSPNHQSSSNEVTTNFLNQSKKELEWINQLETIIHDEIGNFDLNLDSIALKIGVSSVHLNRKVKAITGLTPMKFIDEIRFWEARRLLEEKEELSVKAVAYSVGFKSVTNFSKNFKKRFGDYPSDYL